VRALIIVGPVDEALARASPREPAQPLTNAGAHRISLPAADYVGRHLV
jgi:hypothetical protein